MAKRKYTFDFYGTIDIEAESREDAIKLMGSDNSDAHNERINAEILNNVNFTY